MFFSEVSLIFSFSISARVMADPNVNFRPFKELRKNVVVQQFGQGITLKRERKFAGEAYLSDVKIKIGEGDAMVWASCFASQTKDKKHKVFLAIDTQLSQYNSLDYRCSCAAGRGRCTSVPFTTTFVPVVRLLDH